jgi:hypothetical protein
MTDPIKPSGTPARRNDGAAPARAGRLTHRARPMHPELLAIVEDVERLWTAAGLAELFSAKLASPPAPDTPADPCDIVLEEHHVGWSPPSAKRNPAGSCRRMADRSSSQTRSSASTSSDGSARGPLNQWAREAIATVVDR